jgi:low affinity Fe/Cu permease
MAQNSSGTSLLRTFENGCETLSAWFTKLTASSVGFGCALLLIVAWVLLGFCFHFSTAWHNILSMSTAISTFLMVFLLQRAQSKDILALHIKLNELVASQSGASNRVMNIEAKSEAELAEIRDLHDRLPKDSLGSHSLEHVIDPQIIIAER